MRLPARLFKREPDSHKGDFGHVFILAGSKRFTGAACLCAHAAMRAGAGLVTIGVPQSLYPIVASKMSEAMVMPLSETSEASLSPKAFGAIKEFFKKADCLLIGPGLSQNLQTKRLVLKIICDLNIPMVIDADALNALVNQLPLLKKIKKDVVLTPHLGEMARLLGISVSDVRGVRKEVAKAFSLRYNVVLVLKGFRTIVASFSRGIYVNKTGNPGMATAGSGDVLSGIIAAFLAQGLTSFEAAQAGTYIHGLAGDFAAREKTEACLIASDIIENLPKAFKAMQKKQFVV